jgi:small subunit ribosomal protein S21
VQVLVLAPAFLFFPLKSCFSGLKSDVARLRQDVTKDGCVQVLVRDNNVDQALKALKKKMQREGIFREMKLRGHYEKPSEKRAREKAEAVRRARKLARKKMQREGLLPMKPRPPMGGPAR